MHQDAPLADHGHELQDQQKTHGHDRVDVQHHADLVSPAVAEVVALPGRSVQPLGQVVAAAKDVEVVQLGAVEEALAHDAEEAQHEEEEQVV